jgi:hypothetical protein
MVDGILDSIGGDWLLVFLLIATSHTLSAGAMTAVKA